MAVIDSQLGQQLIEYRKAGLTYDEIAKRVGVSKSNCFKFLKPYRIKIDRQTPGCENCKLNPYALGYCMKCYRRHRRRNGLD